MPQFPLCSEFVPLLDSVKNQLAELKVLSQDFLRSGDDEMKQKALLKGQEIEQAQKRLIELKEEPTDFEGHQILRIEKELLVFFRKKMFNNWLYEVNNNAVSVISVYDGTSAVVLEECLKYLKLFDGLQKFHCDFAEITSLPGLPNNLQFFGDNPAKRNPKIKKQLEEFKKNHPQFEYSRDVAEWSG